MFIFSEHTHDLQGGAKKLQPLLFQTKIKEKRFDFTLGLF
jgi:hypothetical protein